MRAVNPGRGRQSRQLVERLLHLLRGPFEQAAAARAEQGIAGKQAAVTKKSDVRAGMSRDVNDIELQTQAVQVYGIPLAHRRVPVCYALIFRANDFRPPQGNQVCNTADVVRVVMGDQDGVQFEPVRFQVGRHHFSVTRVDHGTAVPAGAQQPDIVVMKGPDGGNGHWWFLHRLSLRCRACIHVRGSLMLTAVLAQVNRVPMLEPFTRKNKPDRALERLVRHAVLPEFARRRPERVLLITPDRARFPALGDWDIVCLNREHSSGSGPLLCDTGLLPFSDDSFDIVLLHHVAVDGREPELHEARRVLCAGGDLFVLGTGRFGLRALTGMRREQCPRLRLLQMCQQLRRRAFDVERCAASGLAGVPVYWERWWQRPTLPLADVVLVHGRHRPLRPVITPLRLGRAQAVGVRSTAAESLFRGME